MPSTARSLFAAGAAERVIAAGLPRTRAAMHIDTVFTFCDRDVVTAYGPVVDKIDSFSLRPDVGKNAGFVFGTDVQRITDGRLALRDKVKMGFELGFGASDSTAPFSLRGGYNLRSPSVGIGADLLFLKVDASYYGEAVEGPGGTRVDMRTLMRVCVDLKM